MTHNDPIVRQLFNEIAETSENLRTRAAEASTSKGFPPDLKVKASLLAYHLRQAHNEARLLAGEKPAEGARA
jgi:hypothetical protein